MRLPHLITLLAGLGLSSLAQATSTHYPLTVDNCGVPLTFQHAPKRTVTIGQSATETLYALGLGDKVVGTSLWFNDVLAAYKALNDKVERLADNDPSFEAVIGKRPELVTVDLEWMVGTQGVVGTREQFHELNVPTYLLPADCEGKDNLVGADGTRLSPFKVDSIYKSITQLATIYDAQAQGERLVSELKARLAKARETRTSTHSQAPTALVWFSSADLDIDPYVAGRKGIPDFMLQTLGVRNIVESDEEWPTVGWETIAKANPSVLVLARMDRRRFPADDVEKKLQFLNNDPVTRNMEAVKHNRIVILDAQAMHASPRLFSGIEELAAAIGRFDLPK